MMTTQSPRSGRLLGIGGVLLGALLILWYLPPRRAHAERVADELGERAGCPRAIPQLVADSTHGLSTVQRCGIVWAALEAVPHGGRAFLQAHATDFAHVVVIGPSDEVGIRASVEFLREEPPEPWLDRQRMASAWVLTVTIAAREYVGVHQIWVDKRTGVARRIVTGASEGRYTPVRRGPSR